MTSITKMQKCHTYEVAEVEKACFSKPWSQKALEAELSNSSAQFYVLTAASQVIGYCGMHIAADEAYIANIAVLPEHQGKGCGKKLTSHLVKTAKEKGCSFITLEVRPSNTKAVALYKNLGFEENGRRKGFYTSPTEDALIMTLNFN